MSEPLLSVEAARERVLAAIGGPLPTETLSPEAALGQVLAAPVMATTDLPPWDNSAMDGYAVRAADLAGAAEDRPIQLRVIGEVPAGGQADRPVEPGTAIRIATGAPLPAGADSVVPVELTTPFGADGTAVGPRGRDATGPLPAACAVHAVVGPGNAVRRRSEDVRAGATVLEAGSPLTPAAVGLAAGCGVSSVTVHRRPRIAVLATGDEVRGPGEPLGPAGIPDANGPGVRALSAAAGATAIDLGIARDDLDDVLARLRRGISEADAVIVSGGVSVGPYDVVRLAFEALGRVDLWRVAVQPGKPFAFGVAPGGVVLFGLPGNPVSGFVTFELFVRPAIRRLAGHRRLLRETDQGVLLEPAGKAPGRRAFLRVVAERDAAGQPVRDGSGRLRVRLAGGQGSHVLSALAAAEALAIVPEAVDALPAGAPVELIRLDPP
ncbi:MAG: molybdopterin molybdotransferase MoeA [Candidatus Limnocylindrales bacterium]